MADGLSEDQPDRASWLFLGRPEGWQDELTLMGEVIQEESEASDSASKLRAVQRRLDTTSAALASTRDDLAIALARIEELESELVETQDSLVPLRGELKEAKQTLTGMDAERSRIVKNLKASEGLANSRLETLRNLEAKVEALEVLGAPAQDDNDAQPFEVSEALEPPEQIGSESRSVAPQPQFVQTDLIDRDALAASFTQATTALAQLMDAFEIAANVISPDASSVTPTGAPSVESSSPGEAMSDPANCSPKPFGAKSVEGRNRSVLANRRSLIRLTKGVLEGTPEGILQILRVPAVAVFVDGYNVSMEAWPHLSKSSQRESLLRVAGSVSARTGAVIHLVFDGTGDGSRPSVSSPLPVRVHFSEQDAEADDLILELLDADPSRPALVVSSDKRVSTGALQRGANSVTSAQMLAFVNSRSM